MINAAPEYQPICVGSEVTVDGRHFAILRYIDLYSVLAVDTATGERLRLEVAAILDALTQHEEEGPRPSSGIEVLSQEEWDLAQHRASLLQPLLKSGATSRQQADDIAKTLGVHTATVYRWVKRLKATGNIVELAKLKPSGGRGKPRINPLADAIIGEVIEERFLTKQRPNAERLMRDITMRCRRAGIQVPHASTVRRRISRVSDRVIVERRLGKKAADDKYAPRTGSFPNADYPGAVWQIDHTPLDLVIVDDVHRRHIGRPWLTVAIDVYSRCIAGFYLSLDKPSEVSVGMCLVHAMLPKDGWLMAYGVKARWPVFGRPNTVHADNAKEFNSSMITRAAEQHRFRVEWRKVKTPNWGGHIERLLGTFNRELHALPGTTFSNIAERGEYAPHKEAALTFDELGVYLGEYICNVYHQKVHSSINRPPIRLYEAGLLGDGTQPGRGLPRPPADPSALRLDFMPILERSVQQYGIKIDGLTYYDPVLDSWIRAKDPETGKLRKFVIRRDPRDVSLIYFLDPTTKQYYGIHFRNTDQPSMSVWELREVKAQLRKEGKDEVDEELIFETFERLNRIVETAQVQKVSARKAAQNKRNRGRTRAIEAAQDGGSVRPAPARAAESDWDEDEVAPFAMAERE